MCVMVTYLNERCKLALNETAALMHCALMCGILYINPGVVMHCNKLQRSEGTPNKILMEVIRISFLLLY